MTLCNCNSYKEFENYIKGRQLICYGAGKLFGEMIMEIPNIVQVCSDIKIVDGNLEKWGKPCEWLSEVYISSPEVVLKKMKKNAVILVTAVAIKEIFSILKRYIDESREVFVFSIIRAYHRDKELVLGLDESLKGRKKEQVIPKIIHYNWFNDGPLPDEYKYNMESWYKFCPDYTFKEWNLSNCDFSKYKFAEMAVKEKKWVFAGDVVRLEKVEEYGGIYLDLDVKLLKPLEDLRYLEAYVSFHTNEVVNPGSGFGAIPHHPMIKIMLKEYEKFNLDNMAESSNFITSPIYQTETLKRYGLVCNGKMQIVNGLTILPMDYLCAKSLSTGNVYITQNTFSVHEYAASWINKKDLANKEYIFKLSQRFLELNDKKGVAKINIP